MVAIDVLTVHGVGKTGWLGTELEELPDLPRPRALGKLHLVLAHARALPQPREQPHPNPHTD
jgi:hypothetical protein